MSRFIQISKWWKSEHNSSESANFKCINCYSIYAIWRDFVYAKDGSASPERVIRMWNYCPNCGVKLEPVYQDIQKKFPQTYVDGSYTRKIDGRYVLIVPPTFKMKLEVMVMFSDEWEEVNLLRSGRQRHDELCWNIQNQRNVGKVRFSIIPSKPLPLPE